MPRVVRDDPAVGRTGDLHDRTVRVLFVDDHQMVAEGLAAVVGDEPGIEVVGVTGTLSAAVTATQAQAPDVVIMDYRLPDGDGAEGTRRLLALDHPPQVVILTASGEDHVLREALASGCCGFLTKGARVEDLIEAIRAAGIGESVFSSDVVRRLSRVRFGGGGPDNLTARELEVLRAIAAGQGTADIARALVLSEHTVRNHVRNVLAKLGAHTKLEAVVTAARAGLIELSGR